MNLLPRTQETLYFQSLAGKMFSHPAGFVRLVWSAERLPIETIKIFYEQALALLLNSGAHKILSDHGQRLPLINLTQQWITENWVPRAMSLARTHHCAIVEGANPIHRLAIQSVVSSAPKDFIFQRFTSVEAAEAWLGSIRT